MKFFFFCSSEKNSCKKKEEEEGEEEEKETRKEKKKKKPVFVSMWKVFSKTESWGRNIALFAFYLTSLFSHFIYILVSFCIFTCLHLNFQLKMQVYIICWPFYDPFSQKLGSCCENYGIGIIRNHRDPWIWEAHLPPGAAQPVKPSWHLDTENESHHGSNSLLSLSDIRPGFPVLMFLKINVNDLKETKKAI